MTEEEMVGRHNQFNGHAFEQTMGNSERGTPSVLQSRESQKSWT